MSVWRNTRGQKWKCNKEGKKTRETYRQKYNTTEQTLSKKYRFKLQTQQMLVMVDLRIKKLTTYSS